MCLRVRDVIFKNAYTHGCPRSAGRWTRQPYDTLHRIALQLAPDLMAYGRFDFDALSRLFTFLQQLPNGSTSSIGARWCRSCSLGCSRDPMRPLLLPRPAHALGKQPRQTASEPDFPLPAAPGLTRRALTMLLRGVHSQPALWQKSV
jgi:hypothetical protein